MLALDQKVTLSCTDTGKDAAGTIVRIVGSRVDVMLDGGGEGWSLRAGVLERLRQIRSSTGPRKVAMAAGTAEGSGGAERPFGCRGWGRLAMRASREPT